MPSVKKSESYGFLFSATLSSYKYSAIIVSANIVLIQLFYQLFCLPNILEKFVFTNRGHDDIVN